MSTYIDLEIIHTLPFANANRDDAGQPKTVQVGGTTRGRLSSQSLKRAARFYDATPGNGFGIKGDTSGGSFFRTKYLKNLLLDALDGKGASDEAKARVDKLFFDKSLFGKLEKKKDKADQSEKGNLLVVVTDEEVEKLADALMTGDVDVKQVEAILSSSSKRDLALWGRFFASSDAATLDGSAQVAHAFTTHAVNLENDFFVGLDDAAPLYATHGGAGHPGDAYFLTGTFYKYANFNLEETILNLLNAQVKNRQLIIEDLSDEEILEQVAYITRAFIKSFVLSVPQGKIRSTAHQTLPSYVRVSVRKGRPVTAATAFDDAISLYVTDVAGESVKRLEAHHAGLEKFVGAPEFKAVLDLTETSDEVSASTLDVLTDSVVGKLLESVPSVVANYRNED